VAKLSSPPGGRDQPDVPQCCQEIDGLAPRVGNQRGQNNLENSDRRTRGCRGNMIEDANDQRGQCQRRKSIGHDQSWYLVRVNPRQSRTDATRFRMVDWIERLRVNERSPHGRRAEAVWFCEQPGSVPMRSSASIDGKNGSARRLVAERFLATG